MVTFIIIFFSLCIGYIFGRVHGVIQFAEYLNDEMDKILEEVFLKK